MSNRLNDLRSMSPDQLLAKAGQVLPPWAALILVLAIAWQLVRITWLLFPQSSAGFVIPNETSARTGKSTTRQSYDIDSIVGANLFGVTALDAVPVAPANVEETQLKLTLRGTIAGAGGQLGLAIIADDRGEEKVYAIGDPVSGGRKLHSVQPEQAILNHNGDLEALRLPRDYQGQAPDSVRNSRNSRASAIKSSIPNERLQTLANNPTKLTDLIRPQPVFSNGKQLGYRVYPGRRRQQFVALGLKPGDLVTEINGSPLDDPAKGAEIFKTLAESNQVTVTVERNGSPEVLTLDMDQLNELQGGQEQ